MKPSHGRWAKAWHGYLAHFWLNDRETLCGKIHMLAHSYGTWHIRYRSTCRKCKEKYGALYIERQKEASR
jgi:hypothetical protein